MYTFKSIVRCCWFYVFKNKQHIRCFSNEKKKKKQTNKRIDLKSELLLINQYNCGRQFWIGEKKLLY